MTLLKHAILACLLLLFSTTANAQEHVSLEKFKTLPIMHEGRLQPIDSVAKFYYKNFTQNQKIKNRNYIEWFAETIFSPEKSIDTPVFYISNPEIFSFQEKQNKLYSYFEISTYLNNNKETIEQLIQKPEENYNDQEKMIATLHKNYILYTQLLRSMTLFIPVDDDTPSVWQQKTKSTKQQQTLIDRATFNVLLRVISQNGTYQSPWQIYFDEDITDKKPLKAWQNLTTAYRQQNNTQWNIIIDEFNVATMATTVEVWYNKLSFLNIAFVFYIGTILLLLTGYMFRKEIVAVSFLFFSIGVLSHLIHIALRSYIMARPPVGTLYESVIFVALTCVIVCWYLYRHYGHTALLIGGLSGSLLLTVSHGLSAEEPIGTLVAVLNTNFWLATHVLCITIGYGLCLLASLLAHIMFIKPDRFDHLLKIILIASLLFTAVGTVLGGIWADQSWGRFWGWDPKENGALLIVLWLAWILHGTLSGHLKGYFYLLACAALSMIVTLAWFGVNLLNIGLHSYGFISGIAWSMGLFFAVEIALLTGLYLYTRKKVQASS